MSRSDKFHYRRFNKVYSSGSVIYTGANMSQFYDVSRSTFIVPSRASIPGTVFTSSTSEFDLFINKPNPLTLAKRGLVISPRKVQAGALEAFRRTLLMSVPIMKDRTHEEIERLIDERNEDILNNV